MEGKRGRNDFYQVGDREGAQSRSDIAVRMTIKRPPVELVASGRLIRSHGRNKCVLKTFHYIPHLQRSDEVTMCLPELRKQYRRFAPQESRKLDGKMYLQLPISCLPRSALPDPLQTWCNIDCHRKQGIRWVRTETSPRRIVDKNRTIDIQVPSNLLGE